MSDYRIGLFGDVGFPDPEQFPLLLKRHRLFLPTTDAMESFGREVRTHLKSTSATHAFDHLLLNSFVHNVCSWGWKHVLAWRILKENSTEEIAEALSVACLFMDSDDIAAEDVLKPINSLKGLDVSFASKHLRMLCPEKFPVLDSHFLRKFPTLHGDAKRYRIFSEECRRVGLALHKLQIPNPLSHRAGKWFAADVESALFVWIAPDDFFGGRPE